ncbi:MAG: tetratricopeptide repeat protein [Elusimicrobia bacterium]|nr:tetratricopeptide repeat protein [Elusimicrobiota bacterium]
MKRASWVLLAALLALPGCDTYHYLAGTWRDDSGRPVEALAHYRKFLEDLPRDPRACEVRLRAAAIYERFGRWAEARRDFEAAARDFPRQPACVSRAKLALLSCPDYFPLDAGRSWVYVDSASRGQAMRQDSETRRATPEGGEIRSVLYAGATVFSRKTESYRKSDWAIWLVDGKSREPILRYPFEAGQSWSATRGRGRKRRRVDWLVVSSTATVSVAAGEFKDCLKVREYDHSIKGAWIFHYYCPGVGLTRTTVGGKGYENPNTELLRFDKMD